jgi:hypothetical protein
MIFDYATDHFTVCNRTPVTFEYNTRRDRTVSDYRFCSRYTGKSYGSFVQRMLRKLGDGDRIVETLDTWR